MMRAAKKAQQEGRITREELRKLRWATLDPAQCNKLEQFAKEEISEDDDGIQLMTSLGMVVGQETISSQKLFDGSLFANWDWEKFFDLLLKLAPIIIAFL